MGKSYIISIGEIVWDHFEDKKVIGGAPLNVAYHIALKKWPVNILSRVGNDDLGIQTLDHIQKLGLSTTGIQVDPGLKTGTVFVKYNNNNEPFYEISNPSAWDNITIDGNELELSKGKFHLVYGTLAQRNEVSRRTIQNLWKLSGANFYDVNLRPPFTPLKNVEESLSAATVVKVNLEELEILGKWFLPSRGTKEEIAGQLIKKFGISLLAITEGSKGAWLMNEAEMVTHPGFAAPVLDTVGCGDGFFSEIITGYLCKMPILECLIRANKFGSFIATKKGATPQYDYDTIMAEL